MLDRVFVPGNRPGAFPVFVARSGEARGHAERGKSEKRLDAQQQGAQHGRGRLDRLGVESLISECIEEEADGRKDRY